MIGPRLCFLPCMCYICTYPKFCWLVWAAALWPDYQTHWNHRPHTAVCTIFSSHKGWNSPFMHLGNGPMLAAYIYNYPCILAEYGHVSTPHMFRHVDTVHLWDASVHCRCRQVPELSNWTGSTWTMYAVHLHKMIVTLLTVPSLDFSFVSPEGFVFHRLLGNLEHPPLALQEEVSNTHMLYPIIVWVDAPAAQW